MNSEEKLEHISFMKEAVGIAVEAAQMGEVPVGAIVVYRGEIIAGAGNRRETDRDPLAHAEILAIRKAAMALDRWRLSGCTLYVSLEPCSMCAGAIVLARIDRLVFGAHDQRVGSAGSIYNIPQDPRLNHYVDVVPGILSDDCGKLLADFFSERRIINKINKKTSP